MKPHWLRLASIFAVTLTLGIAGCVDQNDSLLAPEPALLAKGGVKGSGGKGKDGEKAPKVRGKKKDGSLSEVVLAAGTLPDAKETKDEALIDPATGGCVETSGHFLCVPAGMLEQPTTFKLTQVKRVLPDGTTLVVVDAKAYILVDTVEVSVGSGPDGFGYYDAAKTQPKTVDLYLTPEWATNRPADAEPVALYLPEGSIDGHKDAVIETIYGIETRYDRKGRDWDVVHLKPSHFSEYALGWPNRSMEW